MHEPRFMAGWRVPARWLAALLVLAACHAVAQDDSLVDILTAVKRTAVGKLGDQTGYDQALILKHINDIHQLRAQGRITQQVYDNIMAWHQAENLSIAKKVGANMGLIVVPQQVPQDAAGYRTGSDNDYLVERSDGQPVTVEDINALYEAYRKKTNSEIVGRSGGRVQPPSTLDFNTCTDFMADVDHTTEQEFIRIAAYHRLSGSDTYNRYEAAKVEKQIRNGEKIDPESGGIYVEEMIDQVAKKRNQIAELRARLDSVSDSERRNLEGQIASLEYAMNKYIARVNSLNRLLAEQAGVAPVSGAAENSDDFDSQARALYQQTLKRIDQKSQQVARDTAINHGLDAVQTHLAEFNEHRKMVAMLALELYHLPENERQIFFERNKISPTLQAEVDAQIHEIKKSMEFSPRLRAFLQQTETGRRLLEHFDEAVDELAKDRPVRDLRDITQEVTDRAMLLSRWLEVIKDVAEARSDAELAIRLGRSLASQTHIGMLAGCVSEFVAGDLLAAEKFVIILLCPEASLPEVVHSIGNAAIDLTTTLLFDRQFMALYVTATFDATTGELTGAGDYHGANAVNQFVDDALLPGGDKLVEGVFDRALALGKEKNLSIEVLAGINAAASLALVRALQSTIEGGAPQVMRDNSSLLAACGEVNACTSSIKDVLDVLGYKGTVPLDADANWQHPNLDEAQQRTLKKLLAVREKAWTRAKAALCAGIKAELEARHRAEVQLGQGQDSSFKQLAALEQIFRVLDIYDLGMSWLNYDAGYNFLMRTLVIDNKDQQIKAMEALQRYYAAYTAVWQMRTTLENLNRSSGGQPLDPRPLTGSAPLTADPEFDREAAEKVLTEVMKDRAATEELLLGIKRAALNDNSARLDDDFDRRIYGGLCSTIIALKNCDAIAEGSKHARTRLSKIQVLQEQALFAQSDAAFEKSQLLLARQNSLIEEFKNHYQPRNPSLVILPPPAIIENRGVAGTEYAFRVAASNVPAEAVYTWYQDRTRLAQTPALLHTFSKAGRYTMRVVAAWTKSARTREGGQTAAELECIIGEPGSDAAWSPTLTLLMPRELESGAGQIGRNYRFAVQATNVPAAAVFTWYNGVMQAGTGRALLLSFKEVGQVNLSVSADWNVPGSTGGEEASAHMTFQIAGQPGTPKLDIIPPPDVATGQAKPRAVYTFIAAPENIPDSATYTWSFNGNPVRHGDTASFAFPADGSYDLGVEASWPAVEANANGGNISAKLLVKIGGADANRLPTKIGADQSNTNVIGQTTPANNTLAGDKSGISPISTQTTKTSSTPSQGTWVLVKTEDIGPRDDGYKRDGLAAEVQGQTLRIQAVGNPVVTLYAPPANIALGAKLPMNFRLKRYTFDVVSGGSLSPEDYTLKMGSKTTLNHLAQSLNWCYRHTQKGHEGTDDGDGFGVNFFPSWQADSSKGMLSTKYKFGYFPNQDSFSTVSDTLGLTFTRRFYFELRTDVIADPGSTLAVHLTCSDTVLKLGCIYDVKANVTGGKPPYSYAWSGPYIGSGPSVYFKSDKGGNYTIGVEVADANGQKVTANLPLQVGNIEVALTGVPRKPVVLGVPVQLAAQITADGQPAKGNYVLRWQPHPEAEFTPYESDKQLDTTVTFKRAGKVNVWAVVLGREGGALRTLAESAQAEIEIVEPTYKMTFAPPRPMVGQAVIATLIPEQQIDKSKLDFRWDVTGPVLRPGPVAANDVWHYSVIGTKPEAVTLTANGRSPFYGDAAGSAKGSFTPQLYKVTATSLGAAYGEAHPRVYDPVSKSFVDVPAGAIKVDQMIRFRAGIAGEPLPDEVRWRWSVNDGTTLGNEISQEPAVSRHTAGTIIASVVARNKDDVVLGTGTISVPVMGDESGHLTAGSNAISGKVNGGSSTNLTDPHSGSVSHEKVTALLNEARDLEKQHRYMEAIARYQESLSLESNPQVSAHVAALQRMIAGASPSAAVLTAAVHAASSLVHTGEYARVSAAVTGGVPPYHYTWFTDTRRTSVTNSIIRWYHSQPGDYSFTVVVTDATGQQAKDQCRVQVRVTIPSEGSSATNYPYAAELTVALHQSSALVQTGEAVRLTASVTGGVPPYHYTWLCGAQRSAVTNSTIRWYHAKAGEYRYRLIVTDAAGKQAEGQGRAVAQDSKVATKSDQPQVAALAVKLQASATIIETGQTARVTASASGGVPPYHYEWFSSGHQLSITGVVATYTPHSVGPRDLRIVVTDAAGNKADNQCNLVATAAAPAEHVAIPFAGSSWQGQLILNEDSNNPAVLIMTVEKNNRIAAAVSITAPNSRQLFTGRGLYNPTNGAVRIQLQPANGGDKMVLQLMGVAKTAKTMSGTFLLPATGSNSKASQGPWSATRLP
jgi:hypothetical protein